MTMEEKEKAVGRMVITLCASQICAQDIYEDLHTRLVEAEHERDLYKKAYDNITNEFNAFLKKAEKRHLNKKS